MTTEGSGGGIFGSVENAMLKTKADREKATKDAEAKRKAAEKARRNQLIDEYANLRSQMKVEGSLSQYLENNL